MNSSLFFPKLIRRKKYKLTRKNTYYANYSKYRQEIREDCLGRCVYCDCHENELGGSESMAIDHFRPKDFPEFTHLKNDPHNLVWCCSRCNRLKWNHWPALGTDDSICGEQGFIDPFEVERLDFFGILDDGQLEPLKTPASYLIELLHLNSETPRLRRETRIQSHNIVKEIDVRLSNLNNQETLSITEKELVNWLNRTKLVHMRALDFNLH
ncbi:MAG: hypothetical protein AAF702_17955 [Chloroflexota bacterium]